MRRNPGDFNLGIFFTFLRLEIPVCSRIIYSYSYVVVVVYRSISIYLSRHINT